MYRIPVPTTDSLGRELHQRLPDAAHRWLRSTHPNLFHEGWVEGPHRGLASPVHHVVTVADDTPEADSYVKQLAAHVGEIANLPAATAMKSGPNGAESWIIPNRSHVPGEGAQPEVLQERATVVAPPSTAPVAAA
jgi:hypothetical protein